MKRIRRIELHLPTSWNQMDERQLEKVAQIIIEEGARTDFLHTFDLTRVKTKVFFALTNIQVISPANPRLPVEKQYFVCRRRLPWYRRLFHQEQDFHLYIEQILYWMQNTLKWMEGIPQLTLFPYPMIQRGWRRTSFQGPAALMQDFSWQRFRFAQEYLQYYISQENRLAVMRRKIYKYSAKEVRKQQKDTDLAKAMFLATIYCRKVRFVESDSTAVRNDFHYTSNQSSDNARFFRDFNPLRFQIILIWWSSVMHYLHDKFPHCYGERNSARQPSANPLEVYSRTTAVLEKYTHIKEEDVNNQLYMVVLQHLENMAVETEELERIKKSRK